MRDLPHLLQTGDEMVKIDLVSGFFHFKVCDDSRQYCVSNSGGGRISTTSEGPSGFLKTSALLWYFGGGSIEVSSAHSPPRPCKKMVCGARCGGWKWPKKACGRRRAHCDPAVEQGRRACRGPGSGGARGTTFCSPFRLAPLPLRFHADTAAAQRSPRCHFDAGQEIVKM